MKTEDDTHWVWRHFIMSGVDYHSTNKIIGGVDFLSVHEHAFYGSLWTKSLGTGLFHGVHQHLYSIVAEQAFIPCCWTYPNSLADYLQTPALRPNSKSLGRNLSLETQIPALRPNSGNEAQTLALTHKFQPRHPCLSPKAQGASPKASLSAQRPKSKLQEGDRGEENSSHVWKYRSI